ncbi:Hypothetical predicted protein [Olea europaea subsp. europaea]|uniref:VQ domain-containing protein n=1 Tax=Olea europaea subsp. europaea TaxID=158383 RepID=A0A8S0R296_OLEEU|nr:Hypothetical predicted protein [Olea europaea subsp. europaea]
MERSYNSVSTENSYSSLRIDVIPKLGNNDKPIRKRSKASKKTPTTLLNANTTNFRAVVQQFTGCRSARPYKGPINLNFAVPTQHNDFNETSTISLRGYDYYTQKTHEQHQNYQEKLEDEKFQEDQAGFFSHNTNLFSDDAFVSTFRSPASEELTLDDFDIDNILSQDLPEDYYSAGTRINDDFWGH